MIESLENLVFSLIERVLAGRYSKRHGIVTSWDPDTHMAKIKYQPEGQESGWFPVHTMTAGDGFGHMTGLNIGEQVEVTHQEGEFEAGAITSRVHSKKQKPPRLESGEELFRTPFKSYIKMAKDGSITFVDASGEASFTLDGKGNIKVKGKTLTHDISGEHKITGQPVNING